MSGAGEAVLELVTRYADTWRLLLEYDEDRLETPPGTRPPSAALDHEHAVTAIADFKAALVARKEASTSSAFNVEMRWRPFSGRATWRPTLEKAANLLYFLVKDHPFTDGNKRIASLLFLLYLRQEGLDHDLNQALTALTLLIAESAPANKDLLIRLVVNLLAGSEA